MNKRYGRLVTDEKYINWVTEDMQGVADEMLGDDYGHDAISDMILFRLEKMDIYPDDIDEIFGNLSF